MKKLFIPFVILMSLSALSGCTSSPVVTTVTIEETWVPLQKITINTDRTDSARRVYYYAPEDAEVCTNVTGCWVCVPADPDKHGNVCDILELNPHTKELRFSYTYTSSGEGCPKDVDVYRISLLGPYEFIERRTF